MFPPCLGTVFYGSSIGQCCGLWFLHAVHVREEVDDAVLRLTGWNIVTLNPDCCVRWHSPSHKNTAPCSFRVGRCSTLRWGSGAKICMLLTRNVTFFCLIILQEPSIINICFHIRYKISQKVCHLQILWSLFKKIGNWVDYENSLLKKKTSKFWHLFAKTFLTSYAPINCLHQDQELVLII